MSRSSIPLQQGALVAGVVYSREFSFLVGQQTSAQGINYLADAVEDVLFRTMTRQCMPLSRSNWSLREAGLARAFTFHMAVVTGAPTIVVLVVLVYLDRMRSRLIIPYDCLVHGLVPERLLLGAWILAFQSLYGVPDNRSETWANATRLFTPAEVEQTIDEIKRVLDNDLSFNEFDMHLHCSRLVQFYEAWSDLPMQDVSEPPAEVANDGLIGDTVRILPVPVQDRSAGMSLTGGVQRRSVRLLCRSTGH